MALVQLIYKYLKGLALFAFATVVFVGFYCFWFHFNGYRSFCTVFAFLVQIYNSSGQLEWVSNLQEAKTARLFVENFYLGQAGRIAFLSNAWGQDPLNGGCLLAAGLSLGMGGKVPLNLEAMINAVKGIRSMPAEVRVKLFVMRLCLRCPAAWTQSEYLLQAAFNSTQVAIPEQLSGVRFADVLAQRAAHPDATLQARGMHSLNFCYVLTYQTNVIRPIVHSLRVPIFKTEDTEEQLRRLFFAAGVIVKAESSDAVTLGGIQRHLDRQNQDEEDASW